MFHDRSLWLKFHDALLRADLAAAEEIRRRGHSCGGRLHQGHYPRKARGLDAEAEAAGRYGAYFAGRGHLNRVHVDTRVGGMWTPGA